MGASIITSGGIFCFCLLLPIKNLFSQGFAVGLASGYGAFGTKYYSTSESRYLELVAGIFYQPRNSDFNFKSGLSYCRRQNDFSHFNYIKIPLGFDIDAGGRKFKFIPGFGIYFSYLFNYEFKNPDFDTSHAAFQTGIQFNLGFGYKFNDYLEVDLSPQLNLDLTKMYVRPEFSPGGAGGFYPVKGVDGFIFLRVKRFLSFKSSSN